MRRYSVFIIILVMLLNSATTLANNSQYSSVIIANITLKTVNNVVMNYLVFKSSTTEDKLQIEAALKKLYVELTVKEILTLNKVKLKDTEYKEFSGEIKHDIPDKNGSRLNGGTVDEIPSKVLPGIKILIDNNELKLPKATKVYLKNGKIMIPFRKLFENLGGTVGVRSNKRFTVVWSIINNIRIEFKIGDYKVYRDNQQMFIDAPPEIKKGYTYIPLKYISAMLGMEYKYDQNTNTININTKPWEDNK